MRPPPGPRRPARPAAAARPGARRPAPLIPAEPPRLANGNRRLRLGTVLALTLFVAIGVRLVVLQVGGTTASAESLLKQRQNRLTEVVLPAPRGSILDSSGAVLAHSVEARYIYADPEMIKDPVVAAAKLSPELGIPASRLIQLMAKKKRPGGGASRFEYLARGVDTAVADKIHAMRIPGINSDRDERRDIPGADLAANLIGFTGDDHTGLEGLEARYDELLRGTDGKRVFEIGRGDLAKEIPGGYHRQTDASPGSSIQLTINRDLQFEVQRVLSQQGEKNNATVAAAVVLNARTGEVLAQASYPAYNAAKPGDFKPKDREDVATSVIADPGSTHKAFTIGAALEEGVITPDTLITVGARAQARRLRLRGHAPAAGRHPAHHPGGAGLLVERRHHPHRRHWSWRSCGTAPSRPGRAHRAGAAAGGPDDPPHRRAARPGPDRHPGPAGPPAAPLAGPGGGDRGRRPPARRTTSSSRSTRTSC
ncbi:hypothetical protein GCM10020358_59940 [Amorphoplanes nipponensis]|uniref:peptidoglycan D,D-transpeptidase FtsI family protein n=1 Tax=Actinoplanes nipponensis TaxID=135950 RepID=UPI0031F07856